MIEGRVRCRCFEEGTVSAPPVPRDRIRVAETGLLEVEGGLPEARSALAFLRWIGTGCRHPGMTLRADRLGTWRDLQLFLQALRELGPERFPELDDGFPRAPGTRLDPGRAEAVLGDLFAACEALSAGLPGAALVTGDSRVPLLEVVGRGRTRLATGVSTGLEISLVRRGLELRGGKDGLLRFSSRAFDQRIWLDGTGRVRGADLRDRDSGRTWFSTVAFGPAGTQRSGPRALATFAPWLEVELRPFGLPDLEAMLDRFARLVEASLETGNPVLWS